MDYSLYDEITGGNHTLDEWPLHSNFRLYVRKDVADQLWNFGAGPPSESTGSEADPYTENREALSARLVWGTEGSGSGQFSAPRGLAVSPDGYVYVADSRNHRIQKFTTAGDFVTAWGSYGGCPDSEPEPGTFCEPWDVAVGPDGSVYVADTWADRVQKFTPDGTFLAQWTASGARDVYDFYGHSYFYGPRSLAVDAEGTVYVADTGNKRIQFFGPEGAFMGELGGPGSEPGQLDEPVGVAIGPEGRIYVADTWNYRVQVLESDGTPVLEWPIAGWNNASVEEKAYLAVDEEGRVYVTDPGHYRVLVFNSEGEYLYSFGQFGFADASFNLPMGVALGPGGNLYVTDAGNNRVMVFDLPE
jgi:DNA-binding beta-propeller fold protein YncE